MRGSKYKHTDRVRPLQGIYSSYICLIDNYFYSEEDEEYVYVVHTMMSPGVQHFFKESELEFAGLA